MTSGRRSLDDVRAFFATLLPPGNASLAIAGDIDADEALDARRTRTSATCPPGPPSAPVQAPTRRRHAHARLLLEDRVELPRLYLAWHSPAMFAQGDAELDLVADVLANGKNSRLVPLARLRRGA